MESWDTIIFACFPQSLFITVPAPVYDAPLQRHTFGHERPTAVSKFMPMPSPQWFNNFILLKIPTCFLCNVSIDIIFLLINPQCLVSYNAMLVLAVSYLKCVNPCRLAVDLLRLVVISVKWQLVLFSLIILSRLNIMYKTITVLTFSWTISADWLLICWDWLLIVFIRCSDWLSILFMRWTPKITPAVVIVISRPVIAITPSPDTTGDLRSSLWVWPAYSKSPFISPKTQYNISLLMHSSNDIIKVLLKISL